MNHITGTHKNLTILLLLFLSWMPLASLSQTISSGNHIAGGGLQWPPGASVEGSPYLYDEFIEGEVYDKNLNTRQVPLRLNLHNDEFQYLEYSSILAFADPSSIEKVFIGDEVFIYVDPSREMDVSGFVKKWNSNYPAILTKMNTSFIGKRTDVFEGIRPNRFVRDPDLHYLMKSETEIIKITSVKSLIKTLEGHSTKLHKFAKEKNVSKDSGNDLAKLLDYYHSLEDNL